MDNPVAGYSQCLTAACVEVATCYNDMIVECFQSRLMSHLVRTIKASVKQVISIDHLYCILLTLYTYIH
ncbi:uncharacterized protein RHIMIDRAFT_272432, partial [Rhizopus microsporus ATCC 52813]